MRYICLLYRIIVIIIIACLRRIWSPILLSVLQTELMRVMWIMFFSKLRIWAWFSSAEINGSLSIHLNEAASTFPTLECKTLLLPQRYLLFSEEPKDSFTTPKISPNRSGEKNIHPWGHFHMRIPYVRRKFLHILTLFFQGPLSKWIIFLNTIWKTSQGTEREINSATDVF